MSDEESKKSVVVVEEAGRADVVLAKKFPSAGRRQLARMFDDGAVKLGAKKLSKGDRVSAGDELQLAYEPASGDALRPVADAEAAVQLEVLVELPDLIVVLKPAGMPSQPLRAGERGTAANGIAARWPECAALELDDPKSLRDGGLVHRLDAGTSGALAAARTIERYKSLREAFASGGVTKEYLAITSAPPVARECDAPLAQRGDHVVVDEADGLSAHTTFAVERTSPTHVLVRCTALTGRMHQVRAHLAHVGAPIAGDTLYKGAPIAGHDGFFLHGAKLVLPGELVVDAPPPKRFTEAMAACGLVPKSS